LELRQEASDLLEYSNAKLGRVTRYLGFLADRTRKLGKITSLFIYLSKLKHYPCFYYLGLLRGSTLDHLCFFLFCIFSWFIFIMLFFQYFFSLWVSKMGLIRLLDKLHASSGI
jgi:hypothetical protein